MEVILNITIDVFQWIGTIIAFVPGVGGLTLGIINYLRESPNVAVTLQWDMKGFGLESNPNQLYGIITVTNVGRRPVYISHVQIQIRSDEFLMLMDSITGERLLEGDAPRVYSIIQNSELQKDKDVWDKMRAAVFDSTGKRYLSKRIKKKPSWAQN